MSDSANKLATLGAAAGLINPAVGAALGGFAGLRNGLLGAAGGVLNGLQIAEQSQLSAEQLALMKANAPLDMRLKELQIAAGADQQRQRRLLQQEFEQAELRSDLLQKAGVQESVASGDTSGLVADPSSMQNVAVDTSNSGALAYGSQPSPISFGLPSLALSDLNSPQDQLAAPLAAPTGGGGQPATGRELLQDPSTGRRLPFGPAGLLDGILSTEGITDKRAADLGYQSKWDVTYGYGKYLPDELKRAPISTMTVGEVKKLSRLMWEHPDNKHPIFNADGTQKLDKDGNPILRPTSAVGGPQFTATTLDELTKPGNMWDFNDDMIFDESTQRAMAEALMEKSGMVEFADGDISQQQFFSNLRGRWRGIKDWYSGDSVPAANELTPVAREPLREPPDPDPLRIMQLPTDEAAKVAAQARNQYRSAVNGYQSALTHAGQSMRATAGRGASAYVDNEDLSRYARIMMAYGDSNERMYGMGVLRQLQNRQDALDVNAANMIEAGMKQSLIADQGDFNAQEARYMQLNLKALEERKQDIKSQLDTIRELKVQDEKGNQTAVLNQQESELRLQEKRIERYEKAVAGAPKLRSQVYAIRDKAADAHQALGIVKELKSSLGPGTGWVSSKLPLTGPNSKLRQMLNSITMEGNAGRAREMFGPQFTERESFKALFEIGASIAQGEDVNIELLEKALTRFFRDLAEVEGEYSGLTQRTIPIERGSRYEALLHSQGMSNSIDLWLSNDPEGAAAADPAHANPTVFQESFRDAEERRKRATQDGPAVPTFRSRR